MLKGKTGERINLHLSAEDKKILCLMSEDAGESLSWTIRFILRNFEFYWPKLMGDGGGINIKSKGKITSRGKPIKYDGLLANFKFK